MIDDATGDEEQSALFDVDPDWKDDHWQGMPAYEHQDLQPDTTLLVHFKDRRAREDFARLIGQTLHARTKFVWHPKAEIGHAAAKVFTGEKVTPRYPIYIISKGRADTRLTSKAFEWAKIPYHIVVEPQERDAYAAVIDPAKILVTPFSNLGQGGIPVRNFVWEHSIAAGAARHWIFDDNISGFCRFTDNMKIEVDNGALHCAIEDWVDRYENVAMAAFNYDYFAPRKQGAKIKPITINTRCYSGILLDNHLTHRWRGRYNEDTDLSLRILKDGLCTALFNAFLMYKKPTLTMKGGNADELYKGSGAVEADWQAHCIECATCAQCIDGYASRVTPCDAGRAILSRDGRWLMAESLREQHPDVTTVQRKWGSGQDGVKRWQHSVDYRAFVPQLGRNVLKLKEGIVIEPSKYDLTLEAMPSDEPSARGGSGHSAPLTRPRAEVPSGPSVLSFLKATLEQAVQAVPAQVQAALEKFSQPGEKPATASPGQPLVASEAEFGGPAKPFGSPVLEVQFDPCFFKDYLAVKGHRLLTRDGKFFVSDASTLTDAERSAIKEHREELIPLAEEWNEAPTQESEAGVSRPSVNDAERSEDASHVDPSGSESDVSRASGEESWMAPGQETPSSFIFDDPKPPQSLAQFLGTEPPRVDSNWIPDEIPDLSNVDEIVLNFATDGTDWANGSQAVGVTVGTLDGKLTRFLPFGFKYGGNLPREQVIRFLRDIRGKKIYNDNTKFDLHFGRVLGADFDEQGCTFSDIQHTVALIDDHRGKFRKDGLKPFAIDTLALDYLPNLPKVNRVDERVHAEHHASEVAERERFTADLVWRLRDVLYPELEKQDLMRVQALEDGVIPAVVEMEKNGSPIDVELLEQYGRECVQKHDELMWEISRECGFAFEHTAKGWQHLIESLHLRVPDSFSEAVLDELEHPLIRKGQRASQYASLNSKIFKAYPEHITDGILRYDINQLKGDDGGTASGRFSIGIVQQVPNEYNHAAIFGDELFPRRLFIPDRAPVDGFIPEYLEADAAQIEFRLLVHHSENAKLLQAYRDDPWMSFHKQMQSMLVTYKPDMNYAHTKSYNFAAQYGAKSIKLAIMMGFITERVGDEIRKAKRWDDPRLKMIKEIEAAYRSAHPEAGALLDRASHLMKNECDEYCRRGDALHRQFPHRGYVKTVAGRRSRCINNYKPYIGLNRVLQGTGADVMKKKLTELHAERKHTGFLMRITNHDAVLGDARMPETKSKVAKILNEQSFAFKVPILWECGTGPNWAETK